jgi:hypothetical protein
MRYLLIPAACFLVFSSTAFAMDDSVTQLAPCSDPLFHDTESGKAKLSCNNNESGNGDLRCNDDCDAQYYCIIAQTKDSNGSIIKTRCYCDKPPVARLSPLPVN